MDSADLDAAVLALYWQISRQTARDMSRSAASVLGNLRDLGPTRISELANLEGVTQPTMTTLITRLERDGLVTRTVTPGVPVRVDYALTPLGRSLLDVVDTVSRWADENVPAVHEARRRYCG